MKIKDKLISFEGRDVAVIAEDISSLYIAVDLSWVPKQVWKEDCEQKERTGVCECERVFWQNRKNNKWIASEINEREYEAIMNTRVDMSSLFVGKTIFMFDRELFDKNPEEVQQIGDKPVIEIIKCNN